MDANVLRAALSAAIRVTLSTTLLGCGGVTSREPSSEPLSSGTSPAPGPSPDPATAGTSPGEGTPVSSASGGSNQNRVEPASVVTTGGGGAAAAARGGSQAGDSPPTAGAPAQDESACEAEPIHACIEVLDALPGHMAAEPLDAVSRACCLTLANELDAQPPNQPTAACRLELEARLSAVRYTCCAAIGFTGIACAPWGPPVPPELELEQLLAWEAAA